MQSNRAFPEEFLPRLPEPQEARPTLRADLLGQLDDPAFRRSRGMKYVAPDILAPDLAVSFQIKDPFIQMSCMEELQSEQHPATFGTNRTVATIPVRVNANVQPPVGRLKGNHLPGLLQTGVLASR